MKAHGITPSAYRFESDLYLRVEWRGTAGAAEWAVVRNGACYNRFGEWEVEPFPSSRTEDFFERCRYTLDEALEVAVKAVAEEAAILEELKKRREKS